MKNRVIHYGLIIGLNLLIYFFLLRWANENINLERLADYFRQIPLWALLTSLGIKLGLLALYGIRMALLLGTNFRNGFLAINIGASLNTLLPLRLGEALKLYFCHRVIGIPLTAIFSASVAEKLIDLFVVLAIGTAVTMFTVGESIPVDILFFIGVLSLAGVLTVALFRRYVVRIARLFPKGNHLRRITIDLHKHATSYPVTPVLILTACIWAVYVALVLFSFNAYLTEIHIGILEAMTLLIVMAITIAVPSAPGGIGLFEASIVVYLTKTLSFGNEAALAVASVFHLVIAVPQLFIIAWLLLNRRSNLR